MTISVWVLEPKWCRSSSENCRHNEGLRYFLKFAKQNLPAQIFFRGSGFLATTVLRDFYEDTTEDAYLMSYRFRSEESWEYSPVNRIARLAG